MPPPPAIPALPGSTLPYWGVVGARRHGGLSVAGARPWLVQIFGEMWHTAGEGS